nr:MAG TPA_asm: hypothetical protein [Caudoviricetes sp.]
MTELKLSLRLPPFGSCAAMFTIGNVLWTFRRKSEKPSPSAFRHQTKDSCLLLIQCDKFVLTPPKPP